MEVLQEKDNAMFNRKEVEVAIKGNSGTVSRKQATEEIAGKYGSKELIVIRKIGQRFGDKSAIVEARIYGDKKSLEENEPAFLEERGKPKETHTKPSFVAHDKHKAFDVKEGEQKNG